MESNDKLKEIDIKNRACFYSNNIIKIQDFDLHNILTKNHTKIFKFITFRTKV